MTKIAKPFWECQDVNITEFYTESESRALEATAERLYRFHPSAEPFPDDRRSSAATRTIGRFEATALKPSKPSKPDSRRTCKECGDTFIMPGTNRYQNQVFCSKPCRVRYHTRLDLERRREKTRQKREGQAA